MFPTRIYLSGGGICGVAHVGALQELAEHIPLTAIKEWMGVSAGSLMAMCLAIGFTLDELYDFSTRFDFTHIQHPDSPTGWILHMGMDTGERLQRLVNACLHVKGLPSDLTFHDLHQRFGVSLLVLATDLNLAKGVAFSPKETPNYPVAVAVCASMSYPYYYQPLVCPQTGHSLIDGGVTSNYPLYLVPKEERPRTLSILLRLSIQEAETLEDLSPEHLLVRPLSVALTEKTNMEVLMYDVECIRIPLGDMNVLDFSLSEDVKKDLVVKGRDAVRDWIRCRPKPERRKSF
jgi:predicted acylesterase/phospholipase RssA